jgi:uncharacterized protein YceK
MEIDFYPRLSYKPRMRLRSLIAASLAGCALAQSGCGTIANFATGKPQVYGGVVKDFEMLGEWEPSSTDHEDHDFKQTLAKWLIYLAIFDIELSSTIILDTATLPITMRLNNEYPPTPSRTTKEPPATAGEQVPPDRIYSTDRLQPVDVP